MSGRSELAVALKDALPGWQIVSDARALDSVRKPGAAVLWTVSHRRAPALGLDWFQDEVALWVLTPTDKPADIEDDLDDLLLQLLEALEPLASFAWEVAERGQLNDRYDGYRLAVTCLSKLETDNTEEN